MELLIFIEVVSLYSTVKLYRFISEFSFDTGSEFTWISLVDILEFKKST